MENRYQELLNKLEPYLITSPYNLENFRLDVFGNKISEELIINPLELKSKKFIDHVFTMDEITFGGQGMGMDRWVFFDCSIMPGACFGFAIQVKNLNKNDRDKFNVQDENEYIPLSMYIAIPNADKRSWFGHNLSSLNNQLDLSLKGLGLLTKYTAMECLGIKTLIGATQWGSPALSIHTQISDLKLESAVTPAHTYFHSLCYRSEALDKEIVFNGVQRSGKNISQTLIVDPKNIKESYDELSKLQEVIESGKKVFITGRPERINDKVQYNLRIE